MTNSAYDLLSQVRIVLVEPSHPGNIGGAARAMKNMGLSRLHLVHPERFPDPEATARASGADDILSGALIHQSLADALTGCHLVFGASARLRTLNWPQLDARGCAERVIREATAGEVAIVFGREASGLSNEEMQLCNYLAHIPTNSDFSSLNLGAAVQVFAYELRVAAAGGADTVAAAEAPATFDDVERYFDHLEQVLIEIDFLDPANPRQLMRRLRRLYQRTRLERTELNILRGILTETQRKLRG